LVTTLDFYKTNFFKLAKRLKDPVEKDCHDIAFNSAWFLQTAKLFPDVRYAVFDTVPYSAIDPASDPLSIMRFRTSLSNTSSESGTPFQDTPVKIKPLLFSAFTCMGACRFALLGEIDTARLMYLDVSYTRRDSGSFHVIPQMNFPNLRVLKLRGCRIIDAEFLRLKRITKLWSLDISDNLLTDTVVDQLLILYSLDRLPLFYNKGTSQLPDQHMFEDAPAYERDDIIDITNNLAPLRPDESYRFIKYLESHIHSSSINDQLLDLRDPLLRQTGLTHLYVSDNKLTSRGVKSLLTHTNRLQVLDVGSVEAQSSSISSRFYVPYTTPYAQHNSGSVYGLCREARSQMAVLRIHHSIVTCVPTLINAGTRIPSYNLPLVQQAEIFGVEEMARMKSKKQSPFSPLQNYRVTELTLTGIPMKSYGLTIQRLLDFLHDCWVQEKAINDAKRNTKGNHRTPPLLPGLRVLRLEFLPQDNNPQSPTGGSVSGDRDADIFLASSEGDFSFFSDPNTMSSVSRRGSTISTVGSGGTVTGPTPPGSRKSSVAGGGSLLKRTFSGFGPRPASSSSSNAPSPIAPGPPAYEIEVKDVIEELKKHREVKEGRWSGDLQLIRPKRYRDY
jgi:hypothetical protein